ncbi:E3 ubiquitin-protein ligase Rmd5p [Trichomonascus vanleenenianus]|uniref:ubiquitin-protein ligase RMD5 n=1 Tax=Trichomonascus vanleenenianus TaxID=2268995 RepID=UPI003ECB2BDE
MDLIDKELGKVQSQSRFDDWVVQIDGLIKTLEAARSEAVAGTSNSGDIVERLGKTIRGYQKESARKEKEAHSGISKFSKALDKWARVEKNNDGEEEEEEDVLGEVSQLKSDAVLNKALVMHLVRNGDFSVARKLCEESGVELNEEMVKQFGYLHSILNHIKNGDLGPAIEWAMERRSQLLAKGSALEYSLHKLQYMEFLLKQKDQAKALSYAQKNLTIFGNRYFTEVCRLMTGMLYVEDIANSPYTELFSTPRYEEVMDLFSAEFCATLGLPPEPPLLIAFKAGTIAMPGMIKAKTVFKQRHAEWTSQGELPVELELPDSYRYHSIFVCPVSKEQTTPRNPPMLLPCGHVLGKESLQSICKSSNNSSFKCPYCPMESTYNNTKEIFF